MSDRPLDQIKRDTLRAERAAHLRKQNLVGADPIDALDNVGIGRAYHHDGPYDATLFQRNKDKRYAPVEAVRESNAEALKATPREHIQDSLTKHVPLTGTADFAPGQDDINGRRLSYEEGSDLMRDPDAPGGPYSRYEGIKYHPDDLKGKGEPSYTVERELNKHKQRRASLEIDGNGAAYEMQPTGTSRSNDKDKAMVRQRSYSATHSEAGPPSSPHSQLPQSHSTGKHNFAAGLKKRLGSIRRKRADS